MQIVIFCILKYCKQDDIVQLFECMSTAVVHTCTTVQRISAELKRSVVVVVAILSSFAAYDVVIRSFFNILLMLT